MTLLTIHCPFCLHEGRTRSEYLNREVRCSHCRQSFPISSRVIGDAGRLGGSVSSPRMPLKASLRDSKTGPARMRTE